MGGIASTPRMRHEDVDHLEQATPSVNATVDHTTHHSLCCPL